MLEADSCPNRAIRVYLDQADWSYLQDGKAPEAEARLREAGRDGRVTFYISWTHLAETSQLTEGLSDRLAFLRSFPGTVRVEIPVQDLVNYFAQVLVDAADGRQAQPLSFQTNPLSAIPEEQLINETILAGSFHAIHKLSANTRRTSRAADAGKTKAQLSAEERSTAALLGGREDDFRKYMQYARTYDRFSNKGWFYRFARGLEELIERYGPGLGILRPIEERRFRTAMASGRLIGWIGEKVGLVGPFSRHIDPVFTDVVLSSLPGDIRRDRARLDRIHKFWSNPMKRAKTVAPLACRAAVVESIHYNPAYRYQDSDEPDKEHVVFAPLVDIFTCDKRNVGPLRGVLDKTDTSTAVIRTGRLDEVVEAVEASRAGFGV